MDDKRKREVLIFQRRMGILFAIILTDMKKSLNMQNNLAIFTVDETEKAQTRERYK
ncbi:hypothetical protein [Glaesserella sp.]|uniref:hypothetical protein n=1 Tax=Glaesserella sp. TaxID=2094731 RepID=UPI0035A17747